LVPARAFSFGLRLAGSLRAHLACPVYSRFSSRQVPPPFHAPFMHGFYAASAGSFTCALHFTAWMNKTPLLPNKFTLRGCITTGLRFHGYVCSRFVCSFTLPSHLYVCTRTCLVCRALCGWLHSSSLPLSLLVLRLRLLDSFAFLDLLRFSRASLYIHTPFVGLLPRIVGTFPTRVYRSHVRAFGFYAALVRLRV